jgi:hypothetical protein
MNWLSEPQAIWDLLREAAYFADCGVCSETFDEHKSILGSVRNDSAVLK